MNFWKNSKRPLTPPHFWKIMLQIFYNGYGCIYARRYEGQIVWNACTCLLQSVSCFDFSQYNCWKNIPWTLNLLFLYQFHAQKALFKVPKICNIIFEIENDPPSPFGTFPKIHPIWWRDPSLMPLNIPTKKTTTCFDIKKKSFSFAMKIFPFLVLFTIMEDKGIFVQHQG